MSKYLIKGATIHTLTKGTMEGDLLLNNGKIASIDSSIEASPDIPVIDASGLHAYPGFIDAHCHVGMWEEGTGDPGDDGNETTEPITPHIRALDACNVMDEGFTNAVKGGVTTICTCPGSANVIGGYPVVIKTFGKRIDNMLVDDKPAMKCAYGENPKRVYGDNDKMPATRMAIAGLMRETLYKALDYKKSKESEDGFDFDFKMEALLPVLNREIPMKTHCHRADDIFTAIRIAKEFNIKITLDHCTEAHLIADELAKEDYPIIIGPTFGNKSKVELREKSFDTPRILFEHGISVSIMTDAPVIPIENLNMCAALAHKAGLPLDEAIKTITINPAKTLGLFHRMGSIEMGKDADIVLWDRENPLDIYARAKYVFIDGILCHKE